MKPKSAPSSTEEDRPSTQLLERVSQEMNSFPEEAKAAIMLVLSEQGYTTTSRD